MSFGVPLSSNHRASSEAPGLTYYAELDGAGEHLRRDRSINFMSAQGGPLLDGCQNDAQIECLHDCDRIAFLGNPLRLLPHQVHFFGDRERNAGPNRTRSSRSTVPIVSGMRLPFLFSASLADS